MSYNNTELAEMVCTRISHDLIGNIGALSGAIELMSEEQNQIDEDTLKILTTATDILKARQKFFRIAFGVDSKNIEITELKKICFDYLNTVGGKSNPLEIELNGVSAEIAKVVYLCAMIAAEVCIKGGKIKIDVTKQNMVVTLHSEHKLSESKLNIYKNILSGKKPDENASQYVQLIYLRELLGATVPMSLSSNENSMQMIIG